MCPWISTGRHDYDPGGKKEKLFSFSLYMYTKTHVYVYTHVVYTRHISLGTTSVCLERL